MATLIKKNGSMLPALLTDFFDSDKLFGKNWLETFKGPEMPAANVIENEKEFQIDLAAPGLDKKDFQIEISNGILHIAAEKKEEKKEEKGNYMRREFSYSSFERSFQLPDSVKADDIKSKYGDGILHVTLPKKETAKNAPKKVIPVA